MSLKIENVCINMCCCTNVDFLLSESIFQNVCDDDIGWLLHENEIIHSFFIEISAEFLVQLILSNLHGILIFVNSIHGKLILYLESYNVPLMRGLKFHVDNKGCDVM